MSHWENIQKWYRAITLRSDVEPEVAPTKWATTSHCSFTIARHAQWASSADLPAPASPETSSVGTLSSSVCAQHPVSASAEPWCDSIGKLSGTRERRSINWLTSESLSMYCSTFLTRLSRPIRNYQYHTVHKLHTVNSCTNFLHSFNYLYYD